MAQPNQQNNPLEAANLPVKRKRGRPRKDDVPISESVPRTQRRSPNPTPTLGQDLVGQPVAGILDGVFDAGFLLTVRVGNNGPLLRGMVFDSRLCDPISKSNDIAPHMKMSKRTEFPVPVSVEPLQSRQPAVPPPVTENIALNDGNQGLRLGLIGSEAATSVAPLAVSNEAAPATIPFPGHQNEGLAGGPKLDSTGQGSQSHVSPSGDKMEDGIIGGSEQLNPSATATAAPTLTLQANSEMMQETTTRPVGNDSSKVFPSGTA